MTVHFVSEIPSYAPLVQELATHLLHSTQAFLIDKGVVFSIADHAMQASIPLEDVARELVTFGADLWPDQLASAA